MIMIIIMIIIIIIIIIIVMIMTIIIIMIIIMGSLSRLRLEIVSPLSCRAGQTIKNASAWLNVLASAWYGWRGNGSLTWSSQSASCEFLISDFGCLALAQLVDNIMQPMKRSKGKQQAGYIPAHCIALAPSLLLLADLPYSVYWQCCYAAQQVRKGSSCECSCD